MSKTSSLRPTFGRQPVNRSQTLLISEGRDLLFFQLNQSTTELECVSLTQILNLGAVF